MKSTLTVLVAFTLFCGNGFSQKKIVVLPFGGSGVDEVSVETARSLFIQEINAIQKWTVISDQRVRVSMEEEDCADLECAVVIGVDVGADYAIYTWFNRLGEKIIVQYNLFDIADRKLIYTDKMTSRTVEDLDAVMKRLAVGVVQQKPAEKTAQVGSVTAYESERPKDRKFIPTSGVGFGYLYPHSGFAKRNRILAVDLRTNFETRQYAVTGMIGFRKGLLLNLGAQYFFNTEDFSPYLGMGGGIHVVGHDDDFAKRFDGFDLHFKAGLSAFRTYNFRLFVDVDYAAVFNGFRDRSVTVTIGLVKSGTVFAGLFH